MREAREERGRACSFLRSSAEREVRQGRVARCSVEWIRQRALGCGQWASARVTGAAGWELGLGLGDPRASTDGCYTR